MENVFSALTNEQKDKIIREVTDPKTPYVKQELNGLNWLVELFRDTLLPKP